MPPKRYLYILFCCTALAMFTCVSVLYWAISAQSVDTGQLQTSRRDSAITVATKKIEVVSWKPRIFVHHEFLSPSECDHIISLAARDVVRSGVTGKDGEVLYNEYRTSHGIFISKYMNDPVVVALADRIEEWTLLPKEYGEVFYLLRYEPGQEYKQHTDWFQGTPESLAFLGPAGNRLATVIVYLSEVDEGGETSFPAVGLKIRPKKGDAIMFWNRTPDFVLDPLALHSSLPVIKGTKWSITRWIRERGM